MAFVDGTLGPRVRWAFADRLDGVSLAPYDACNLADHVGDDLDHVRANRTALAAVVGVDGGHVVTMAPVHGNDVGQVDGPTPETVVTSASTSGTGSELGPTTWPTSLPCTGAIDTT